MRFEDIELTGSITFTGSFIIPLGAPSNRESSPTTGSLFYNTNTKALESYNGNQWVSQSLDGGDTPAGAEVEYLVVAGGGGGGSYGGGGAGGYLSSSFASLTSGSSYTITVGAAGAGSGNNYNNPGNAGNDSSISGTGITTVTATGGGYGGDNDGVGSDAASDGGSGGGGSDGGDGTNAGGSGTTGQGNDGGDGAFSAPSYSGGGGGGAGTAGSDASAAVAGAGGNGLASSITGTSITRAGGGGGVTYRSSDTQAAGGTGGGGEGGTWSGNTNTLSSNTAGTTNTGGGGGSGAGGGSGVVILAYPTSSYSATGGVRTTRSDGYAVHTFNSSGTFNVGGSGEMGDGVADFFGDSSNIFTLDIATGTLGDNSLESGFTLRGYENRGNRRDGVVVFSDSVPTGRTGWGRSMTLSDNQDDVSLTLDFPSTYTNPHNDVKAYCFWVYVDAHDNDDITIVSVNLRRQNVGTMYVYAFGSSTINDSFSTVSTDTWHHICVVDEGTTMRTYLNGSSLGTHSIGSNTLLRQEVLETLGDDGSSRERAIFHIADSDASNEIFITGLRMFNRSLTASEVTMLYNENP